MFVCFYKIEVQLFVQCYVCGWYCFGFVCDYQDGKLYMLNIFGCKFVVFVDLIGKVNVVDVYCLYMGVDLSFGMVQGDIFVCLFYGWVWNGEGQCVLILYCKWILLKVCIGVWLICEENNLLFVWNDLEGYVLLVEVVILCFDVCFLDEWLGWVIDKMVIYVNCCELVDNILDVVYFVIVYCVLIDYFVNLFEYYKVMQLLVGCSEKFGGDSLIVLLIYFGLVVYIMQMMGQSNGQLIYLVLLNCYVLIDMNSFELWYGVIVKKVVGLFDEQNMEIVNVYVKEVQCVFYEDVDIWYSKMWIDNLLLCEGDGLLYQMCDWYLQFYLDVVDVWFVSVVCKVFEMCICEGDVLLVLYYVFELQ